MRCAVPALCLVSLGGCYYMQAVRGQFEVLARREPLDEVIADPDTAPELAARLELLESARRFASEELGLPDNDSYRSYADLDRDYVVWNVIAAPEFSLEPKTWCYLVVGCVAYRGYFSRKDAYRKGRELRRDGYDVFVGGVTAYSTLGRFADPILNTMMRKDDLELVSLLFHELAHQRLYVDDATEFNESFATAVAEIGLERWLEERGGEAAFARWQRRQERRDALTGLVGDAIADLERLYASGLPAAEMRRRKSARLAELGAAAAALGGGGKPLAGDLNNARLVSLSLYRGKVDAFLRLLDRCGGDLGCFYDRAAAIAELPADERRAALEVGGEPAP